MSMDRTAYVECQAIDDLQPVRRYGAHAITIELRMTDDQRKQAILSLLGDMPEQAAFDWIRDVMPEWFKVAA
jgi:hypothetical protein